MTETAERRKLYQEALALRRDRPELYEIVRAALELPETLKGDFIRQAMPILKKYMN